MKEDFSFNYYSFEYWILELLVSTLIQRIGITFGFKMLAERKQVEKNNCADLRKEINEMC